MRDPSQPLPEEFVRHLEEHAGAIARIRFRAARPAMIQVRQDLQPIL